MKVILANIDCRSQVYVEGDVSINTYVDAEGVTKSSLNVVQRKSEPFARAVPYANSG